VRFDLADSSFAALATGQPVQTVEHPIHDVAFLDGWLVFAVVAALPHYPLESLHQFVVVLFDLGIQTVQEFDVVEPLELAGTVDNGAAQLQ